MAYDAALQVILDEIWFRLPASTPIAEKERRQKCLIRAFQIYARGTYGAVEQGNTNGPIKADELREVHLGGKTQLPRGVPHGDADPATIDAIKAWQAARLRCPVIFEARTRKKSDPPNEWPTIAEAGFFFHDQFQNKVPRVFVRDYTGRQRIDENGVAVPVQVGTAIQYPKRWGIKAGKSHSHNAAITPERFCGKPWTSLNAAEQSTYRVVAALATVESECVFDGINGYDRACFSAGPFHYTAFPGMKPWLGAAELGAFLAFFRNQDTSEHDRLIAANGVSATRSWSASMFDTNIRVFTAELGFVAASGNFDPVAAESDRDWIRTWHSFYLIQHALRNSAVMQAMLWPYARQRLSDLLTTPWTGTSPPGVKSIGDVFKSERSIAMLARWHVYRPAHVVQSGVAHTVPVEIVKAAGLSLKHVSKWTDDDEVQLAAAFIKAANDTLAQNASLDLRKTLAVMLAWRRSEWSEGIAGPTLRANRGFTLDRTGIPFPPLKTAKAKGSDTSTDNHFIEKAT